MNLSNRSMRWTAAALAASLTLGGFAPAALADRGGRVRYKYRGPACNTSTVQYNCAPSRVYIERRSSVAPALVGFLGGLVVGSALHSHPTYASVSVGNDYWDPYCHESFASLDAYYGHVRHVHHPRVVRVIEVRSGDCLRSYEWDDGRWCERDPYFQARWSSYRSDEGCDEDWDD